MTQPYGQQPTPPGQPSAGPAYAPQPEYREPVSRFNVPAAVLAVIAAVLGILSVTVLAWYRANYSSVGGGSGSGNGTFSKIHDVLNLLQTQLDSQPAAGKLVSLGVAPIYFSWLAYVLLAVAVLAAIASAAPLRSGAGALRAIAVLVSVAGLGVTFWAIDLISFDSSVPKSETGNTPDNYVNWLKHTSFGAWAMMLAFLLCLVAALVPAKRQRSRGY